MDKPKMVIVEWEDTAGRSEWETREEILKWAEDGFRVVSVGHLVFRSKERIIVASMYCEESDMYNDYHKIPIECVKKITEV